jgi:hypothetical protein
MGDKPKALEFAKKSYEKSSNSYVKSKNLLEKLQKEASEQPSQNKTLTAPPQANSQENKSKYLLTNAQLDFIMEGYSDGSKKTAAPSATEEEFITFGAD